GFDAEISLSSAASPQLARTLRKGRVMTGRLQCILVALVMLALAGFTFAEPPKEGGALTDRVADITRREAAEHASLDDLYKHLHTHPELSLQEEATSGRLAEELKKLGFEVTTSVGGHGVVGVLENGKGPTILVRTDMDALPVTEQTGLSYASNVRV